MKEGWRGDEYLIIFSENESREASVRYSLPEYLPGYELVGLIGWDDFIVKCTNGDTYAVPTVPLDEAYLRPFALAKDGALYADERFANRIKWYIKPLVFGGNLTEEENIAWVSHEQHAQLVAWWNTQYRAIKAENA